MHLSEKKMERLIRVARMYYEEGRNQNDIAAAVGVSRPMISRMLQEARDVGIVHIQVLSHLEPNELLLNQLRNRYPLQGGVVVPSGRNQALTNSAIAAAAITLVEQLNPRRLGLGWGSIIGTLVDKLEESDPVHSRIQEVFPLVGNMGGGNRNYHTNELVRMFAQQTGSTPYYLHAPAFFTSTQELAQYKSLENYTDLEALWAQMDGAVVNIGNYPSTPDFATKARFQDLLDSRKAAGRILSYYYTKDGAIIHSDSDFSLQIPLDCLSRCRNVTAICSGNVRPHALAGALRTGLVQNLVASDDLVRETIRLS